ncbi:hypothetical protein DFH09DRAFT_1375498 [Mycena vulgaris]|nr:hypothetical protein DFH09DRAFT_1375498 [Mycena vulgaris]
MDSFPSPTLAQGTISRSRRVPVAATLNSSPGVLSPSLHQWNHGMRQHPPNIRTRTASRLFYGLPSVTTRCLRSEATHHVATKGSLRECDGTLADQTPYRRLTGSMVSSGRTRTRQDDLHLLPAPLHDPCHAPPPGRPSALSTRARLLLLLARTCRRLARPPRAPLTLHARRRDMLIAIRIRNPMRGEIRCYCGRGREQVAGGDARASGRMRVAPGQKTLGSRRLRPHTS